jgi:hypothetical protein
MVQNQTGTWDQSKWVHRILHEYCSVLADPQSLLNDRCARRPEFEGIGALMDMFQ